MRGLNELVRSNAFDAMSNDKLNFPGNERTISARTLMISPDDLISGMSKPTPYMQISQDRRRWRVS